MRTLAWIMVLIGTPVAVGGFFLAAQPLIATYRQALQDPLSDAMPSDGTQVSKNMLVPGLVGVLGGTCASAGSLMLFTTKRRSRLLKPKH
jgi:hypothetical protein